MIDSSVIAYDQLIRLFDFVKSNPEEFQALIDEAAHQKNKARKSSGENNPLDTAQREKIVAIEESEATFLSTSYLDFFYAFHLIQKHLVQHLCDHVVLIDEIEGVYREHDISNEIPIVLTLVILKNYYRTDILNLLRQSDKDSFWFLYEFVCQAIPMAEVDAQAIEASAPTILEQTKNDLTQSDIFTALSRLAETQPKRGQEIVKNFIALGQEQSKLFIAGMLQGIARSLGNEAVFSTIKELIESDDQTYQKQGILAASNLDYTDTEDDKKKLAYLAHVLEKKADDTPELLSLIARVYGNLLEQLPRAKEQLLLLAKSDNPHVQHEVARTIWRSDKYDTSDTNNWRESVLLRLATVHSDHKGIIDTLSYTLSDMVKASPLTVVSFLNEWIQYKHHKPKDILNFVDVFRKLYELQRSVFEELVTDWFNQDDIKYPATIATVLRDFPSLSMDNLTLHADSLSKLSFEDVKFILYKILGFVYMKEHLRSLVFSALKGKPNDQQVEELLIYAFTTYIAYNYPSTDEDFLREKTKTGTKQEKRVARKIIKHINLYFQQHRDLPRLAEFTPSERRESIRQKAYAKTFAKSYDQHEKDHPSLSSMLTTIQLKSGNKWFAKIDGQYSEESKLGRVQSSIELPIGLLTDPVGQEKLRFIWRNYTR